MSSTAILTEIKSDSLQYLAVLSLNRISISEANKSGSKKTVRRESIYVAY